MRWSLVTRGVVMGLGASAVVCPMCATLRGMKEAAPTDGKRDLSTVWATQIRLSSLASFPYPACQPPGEVGVRFAEAIDAVPNPVHNEAGEVACLVSAGIDELACVVADGLGVDPDDVVLFGDAATVR